MNKADEKYNSLINKLKSVQPVLNHPEELTESIMSSLKNRKTNKVEKIIVMARPWISIAAVILVGVFIFQQTEIPKQENPIANIPEKKTEIEVSNCLTKFLIERNHEESFFTSYLCYLKETELKNNRSDQFLLKIQHNL